MQTEPDDHALGRSRGGFATKTHLQVITDAAGRLVRASAALPGATQDLTAARTHGIIDALTSADVMIFADNAYQGACGSVRTRSSVDASGRPSSSCTTPKPTATQDENVQ